jgi:formate dehydrogenase major subunit
MQDLQNADCILIEGSSMAESHPVAYRWTMKARERGATIIHVDPRFSRTSAMADIHVPIRAGSDIAWLGGLIRHVIETESYFKEYVLHYTNASTLVNEEYVDSEDTGGWFSGWDAENGAYDPESWRYEGAEVGVKPGVRERTTQSFEQRTGGGMHLDDIVRDETLQHPRCVFQILRRHFARYTPEVVEQVCGIPQHVFHRVAETLVRNSGRERTTALCYAVGWTQHSAGVQIIRAAGILQLLLGNIGRPGGGILALRGHATIQGSTDIPTLYDILPGYLRMPHAREGEQTLDDYINAGKADRGWWSHFDVYAKNLLKAWFGDAANDETDWGFPYLPKITGNHSHFPTLLRAFDGKLDGLFVLGQNPAVGGPNAKLERHGLARLKWLVVRDFSATETAMFWHDSPEVQSGEMRPEEIGTEIFLMPAATHAEKDGSFTNTQRLIQWRDKVFEPPADARSELWFMHHLMKRVRAHYAHSDLDRDWPIRNLTWDYQEHGDLAEIDGEDVLKEINGYDTRTREPVSGFGDLAGDGSTACGCWIYSGVFADGVNQARRRDPGDLDAPGGWVSPEWGYAWPANRRMLYNRASADPAGKPWSERKRYIWWDEAARKWTGYDVPDFPADKPPDYRPERDARGMKAISGTDPFIMMPDGRGWLFAPTGLLDGPLPAHYEPIESPVRNLLYPKVQHNPAAIKWDRRGNPYAEPGDPAYPHVATTFRLTEHHTAGAMSRNLPWLVELQPAMFAELDPALADEYGIEDGGWMTVMTPRGEIEARAKVSERMRPLRIEGRIVHQVAMPWHWGFEGLSTGDSANVLVPLSGDPNTTIQESKVFVCQVRAGRRDGE